MNNTKLFYIQKINLALDYIDENFGRKITTIELASISAFSEFHFHRIFKAVTGETVNRYVKRLKMGKSKRVLQLDNKSITDIALDYGYKSSANFARDFKQYYSQSASEIRHQSLNKSIMIEKPAHLKLESAGFRDYSSIPVLYKRVLTGYDPEEVSRAFRELYEWIQKNKIGFNDIRSIGIGYDDPDYIDPDKCRYDACITFKKKIPIDTEPFSTKTINPGRCRVFRFEGKGKDFGKAWDYVFKTVINSDGIRPGDKPHFEEYLVSERFSEGIFKVNLCLPVLPIT